MSDVLKQLEEVRNLKVGELLDMLGKIDSNVSKISIYNEDNNKTLAAIVVLRGDNVDKVLDAIDSFHDEIDK